MLDMILYIIFVLIFNNYPYLSLCLESITLDSIESVT